MPSSQYDPALLNEMGTFYLCGDITQQSISEAIEFILYHNLCGSPVKELNLIINSSGGDLYAAFALIDIIKGSKIPIHTIGIGHLESAALLIFMTGKKGHRKVTKRITIMSHQWNMEGVGGKAHDLIATSKHYGMLNEQMLDHYVSSTGLSKLKIKKYLLPPEDVYLTAEEAVKYGLVDEIVDFV